MTSRFEQQHGQRSGKGARTLILSHGFGTDQNSWSALRPWCEERFDTVSFDLAGSGAGGAASYDFDRHESLYGYVDDLIEMLDELDVGTCTYIGHSMSGMIGAIAASVRPERFERLIMVGTSPRYLNDPPYVGGFEQADVDRILDAMSANYQAWVAGFAPLVVGVPDERAIEQFSRTLYLMRPDIALSASRTIWSADVRRAVARLRLPVHVIQTSVDVAVPVEVGHWLADTISGATLDIIDAEGHLPHITAPDQLRETLARHLDGAA